METVLIVVIAGIYLLLFYKIWFLPRHNDRKITNTLKAATPVLKKLVEIAKKKYKIKFAYHQDLKTSGWLTTFDKNSIAKEIEVPHYLLNDLKTRDTASLFDVTENFEFSLAHEIGHIELGLERMMRCRHFNGRDCLYQELRAHKKALEILQGITDFNAWRNCILSKYPPSFTFFKILMVDTSLQCMHCTKRHSSGQGRVVHNDCIKKDEIDKIYYELENLLS